MRLVNPGRVIGRKPLTACGTTRRQGHHEGGAHTRLARHRDVAAVCHDDRPRDRQAEARPAALARTRLVYTEEAIEHAIHGIARYADAGVHTSIRAVPPTTRDAIVTAPPGLL